MVSSGTSEAAIREMENEAREAGNKLLRPPSSRDELLKLLNKTEWILTGIYQEPSRSTAKALLPVMNALITEEIFKHSDGDIQIVVASCFNELTRITAPEYTYSDELLQEIFRLFMYALRLLPTGTGINLTRAQRILDTMAIIRTCLIMWDLDLDAMVVEMFQLFFDTIKSKHNEDMLKSMEAILTIMINDSNEVSLELLKPLLDSVKLETKKSSPVSWELGRNVFKKCATNIKPYLKEAVKTLNLNFTEYAGIVKAICTDTNNGGNMVGEEIAEDVQCETAGPSGESVSKLKAISKAKQDKSDHANDGNMDISNDFNLSEALQCGQQILELKSSNTGHDVEAVNIAEHVRPETDIIANSDVGAANDAKNAQSDLETVTRQRRRDRKLSSLIRPEEGYEQPWISRHWLSNIRCIDGRSRKRGRSTKKEKLGPPISKTAGDGCPENSAPGKVRPPFSKPGEVEFPNSSAPEKLGPPTSNLVEDECPASSAPEKEKKCSTSIIDYGVELVKTRIMVWWPLDRTFYTGTVESFDPVTKKHKIVYDDDEEEVLDLSNERWEVFNEGRSRQMPSSHKLEAESPPTKEPLDCRIKSTQPKRKVRSSEKQMATPNLSKRLKTQGRSNMKSGGSTTL